MPGQRFAFHQPSAAGDATFVPRGGFWIVCETREDEVSQQLLSETEVTPDW